MNASIICHVHKFILSILLKTDSYEFYSLSKYETSKLSAPSLGRGRKKDEVIKKLTVNNWTFHLSDCYSTICQWDYERADTYTRLVTDLEIFLTLQPSVAPCERTFSKYKLSLIYDRQNLKTKISDQAIFSIENVTSSLDYNDIINDFTAVKARKVKF